MKAIWIFTILISQAIFAQEGEKAVVMPYLQALAKVEVPQTVEVNPLPADYNWKREARREEIIKDIVTRDNYWDCQMRELPPDAYRNVTLEASYRAMTK